MKLNHVVVQQPVLPAQQLFLLYHGVGDNPTAMSQIGRWFAEVFPTSLVVCLAGREEINDRQGSQWFTETELGDTHHQQRVDAAMPDFINSVHYWQQSGGIQAEATALVGFSQGATMVLEAIKADRLLAGRAIAFSGSYAGLPQQISTQTTIHLIHGEYDKKVPVAHIEQAAERLTMLGGDVTLDIVEDLAHAIDQRSMALALDHLRYTVPKRYFDQAMSGATPGDDDVVTFM